MKKLPLIPPTGENDTVSILLAARNEEANILRCLQSLDNLDYPKDKIQILVGNDASTDQTTQIVQGFIQGKPHFQLFEIQQAVAGLQGKANVLAQLAHHSTGQYFFYTDADISVPPTWIQAMLPNFTENVGVVTACTLIEGKNVFQHCQGIEWLMALALIKQLADFKIPVTGMGNNMAVTAQAYWQVGGYEKIGFSIVEDYALFEAILQQGYDFKQLYAADVLAKSTPPENLYRYFHQRKRWLTGGFESKSILLLLAFLQAIFLPVLFLIGITISWQWAVLLLGIQALGQSVFVATWLRKIKQLSLIRYIVPLQFYTLLMPLLVLGFFIMPTKINWKGREY